MKRLPEILFFDIDGTLVSFQTHRIPQSTVDAIAAAREAGCRIVIATGRPLAIINNVGQLQERGLVDGYVTCNGAYSVMGPAVLHSSPVPPGQVAEMRRISDEYGYPCLFVGADGICVYRPDEEVDRVFRQFLNVGDIATVDIDAVMAGPVYQMTAFFTPDRQAGVERMLPDCEFNRWYPTFVDITAAGNDKAAGIQIVADRLSADISATMAFGDGGNDIPMLRRAGTGVAMGNAGDDVKAAADYVTATVDDDGVARALRHFGVI